MSLRELYQEIVMDHYSNPRNFGKLEAPDYCEHLNNPSCGDEIDIEVMVQDGKISKINFHGQGCVLSQASASMMTELVKDKEISEVKNIADNFRNFITGTGEVNIDLQDLEVLEGVKKYPIRVKCATLSWNALRKILEKISNV